MKNVFWKGGANYVILLSTKWNMAIDIMWLFREKITTKLKHFYNEKNIFRFVLYYGLMRMYR